MGKGKRLFALLLACIIVFALTIPAAALDETISIEITTRGIKIVVDGAEIVPTDANGDPVEPFIYDGTTYLPVRAVAGALGLSVEWHEQDSAVILASGAEVSTGNGAAAATNSSRSIEITYRDIIIFIDGAEITPTDANGDPVEPFIYNGTTYLPVRAVAAALGVEVGWVDETSTVYLGEQPATIYWLLETETDYYSDGTVYYVDTYTYDEYGRNISVATHYPEFPESDSVVTRTYDGWNVVFEDYGDGYSRYAYDEAGNVISDKYYYGGSMTEWQYTYDEIGNLITSTTISEGEVLTYTDLTYDEAGNPLTIVTEYPDYTAVASYSYVYNDKGLVASVDYAYSGDGYEYGLFYSYLYDDEGRLVAEYQYWEEDGIKQYYDTYRYSYDAYGNLTYMECDSGYTTYSYSAFEV